MSQIIAGTYELGKQIGAGGGGVVYLGRHLRLDKPVVLKADKRTLSARPETLRREVDALKNLSHTYIPQVYDFIAENGVVYTVMDYIEGESLDRPLSRGVRFSQAQIIQWACQLLEALCYLHSRPPHGILHSDIKPANIMLTPQGDIRLIDFNIALALGEEGTVRVGYSRGYASPEHYGTDLTFGSTARSKAALPTEIMEDSEGGPPRQTPRLSSGSSGSSSGKMLTLDARSDVYSLGATLYHLLTGRRPAQKAVDVVPITDPDVSKAVSAIIQKAMAPDPNQRYQSAQEMLDAFEHLHENDPRTRKHKRRMAVTAAVLAALFLAGGACSLAGLRQMQQAEAEARLEAEAAQETERRAKELEQAEKAALAAVRDSEQRYQAGDIPGAIGSALAGLSEQTCYQAQAQKALTDALGVYDLKDGFRAHALISLPSEPLDVQISPQGTRTAVMVLGELLIFDSESGVQLAALPAEPSALAEVVFMDEDTVFFAGKDGLSAYDLTLGQALWTGGPATGVALSADGSTVATVYQDEDRAMIYDARTGAIRRTVSFEGRRQYVPVGGALLDLKNDLFALDGTGRHLAVSFSDGSLWIYDLEDNVNDLLVFDGSEGVSQFKGAFCWDGLAIAFRIEDQYQFGVVSVAEAAWAANFPGSTTPYFVGTTGQELFVSLDNILIRLDLERGIQIPAAYTDKSITVFSGDSRHTATASQDGALSFFSANNDPEADASLLSQLDRPTCDFLRLAGNYAVAADRNTPALQILKLEDHSQAQLFRYDPQLRHREARVSADGTTVMLFWTEQFSLFRLDGTPLATVDIPDPGQIFDQQYRRQGEDSYLEVIYYDGLVRTYSAADGSLRSQEQRERPDESRYDEFSTNRWRVTPNQHGTPVVYDKDTGAELGQLRSEDYLTYVTQVGDCAITEYIDTQGERYGLLLDGELQTLAYLPDLCDITQDGVLVFDDMLGNLRQSRIYSVQELAALAED